MPIPGYMRVQSNLRGLITTPSLSSFLPSQISGLKLWLAADRSTLWQDSARTTLAAAEADPVGAWDDLSGNGNHVTQATGTKRFTLRLGSQNGRPALQCDGVDDYLQTAAITLAQPLTAFVAYRQTWGNTRTILDGRGTVNKLRIHDTNPGVAGIWLHCGTALGSQTTSVDDAWNQVYAIANGASSLVKVNDNTFVSGNAGTGNPAGITLASAGDIRLYMVGYFGEVVIYNQVLTSSEINAMVAYLRSRWGTPDPVSYAPALKFYDARNSMYL